MSPYTIVVDTFLITINQLKSLDVLKVAPPQSNLIYFRLNELELFLAKHRKNQRHTSKEKATNFCFLNIQPINT